MQSIAVAAAAAGKALDPAAVDKAKANLGYEWTIATDKYPVDAVGDALVVSKLMHAKYAKHFLACA